MASCKDCFHCRACHEMYLIAVAQEDDFFERNDADTCEDFINTADVAEVKHGEWKEHYAFGCWHYDCPFCDDGYATKERDKTPPNYCPNCGAKMDGGKPE